MSENVIGTLEYPLSVATNFRIDGEDRLIPMAVEETSVVAAASYAARMARAGEVVRDPDRTAFRVVTIPETMAIHETRRLVARLEELDIPVTSVVVNRVLEEIDEEGGGRLAVRLTEVAKGGVGL